MNPICRGCSLPQRENVVKVAQTIGIALAVIAIIGGVLGVLASRISLGPLNAISNKWGLFWNTVMTMGGFILLSVAIGTCCDKKNAIQSLEVEDLSIESLRATKQEYEKINAISQQDFRHCPPGCYIRRNEVFDEHSKKQILIVTFHTTTKGHYLQWFKIHKGLSEEEMKTFKEFLPEEAVNISVVEEKLSGFNLKKEEYFCLDETLLKHGGLKLYVVIFHRQKEETPDYFISWDVNERTQFITNECRGSISRSHIDLTVTHLLSLPSFQALQKQQNAYLMSDLNDIPLDVNNLYMVFYISDSADRKVQYTYFRNPQQRKEFVERELQGWTNAGLRRADQ